MFCAATLNFYTNHVIGLCYYTYGYALVPVRILGKNFLTLCIHYIYVLCSNMASFIWNMWLVHFLMHMLMRLCKFVWIYLYSYSLIHTATAHCRRRLRGFLLFKRYEWLVQLSRKQKPSILEDIRA